VVLENVQPNGDLTALSPQELTDGRLQQKPAGPVSKMGANQAACGNPILRPPVGGSHFQSRHRRRRKALSSLHFSSSRLRGGLQSGPMKRWGRTGEPANPNSSTACSAGSSRPPQGPVSKMGATMRLRKIPSCERLFGGSHFRARHGGDASALSLRFSQPPARGFNPGPTKRWGRPAKPAKTQQTFRSCHKTVV